MPDYYLLKVIPRDCPKGMAPAAIVSCNMCGSVLCGMGGGGGIVLCKECYDDLYTGKLDS